MLRVKGVRRSTRLTLPRASRAYPTTCDSQVRNTNPDGSSVVIRVSIIEIYNEQVLLPGA